ncbi:MAG: hypothetical protein FIA99_06025 [Ruminiclostridium sp.]|nr:hypothetical protein [Ruminiclostridium sp.]
MLTERENYLRNATFGNPQWIPIQICISDAAWDCLRYELEDIVARHPILFPDFQKGWRDYEQYDFGGNTKGKPFTDSWGCIWETAINGIVGVVTNAPLSDWKNYQGYKFPNAHAHTDSASKDYWDLEKVRMDELRIQDKPVIAHTQHGFLLMRLEYLRGFENLMIDIATGEPKLEALIDKIVEYNMAVVDNYLNIGIDVMTLAEDLGTQNSTLISPGDLRKWIMPGYRKLIRKCKAKKTLTAFHSDGKILDIIDDLIGAGVDIINPQDLCNGIENLERYVKGRACIQLDVDRQKIIPFGTKKEICELIEEEVKRLGDPTGGFEFIVGIYPSVPPENIDALFEALEKYRTYWWK